MKTRPAAFHARPAHSILISSILLGLAPALAAPAPLDEPKPAWRNGPVRLILTQDEEKAYKGLKTDEQRAKAIEQFWQRRDPTEGTPENEYRQDFYARLEEANKTFRESSPAGWLTERGKMLLIAGYPDSRTQEREGREIWVYERAFPEPSGEPGQPREYRVVFERNEAGDFRMSEDGSLLLNELSTLDPGKAASMTVSRGLLKPAGGEPDRAGAVAAGAKAPRPGASQTSEEAPPPAPEVPPEVERLRLAALADEPRTDIGLASSVRYFKAEDGSTRTVVVIAVKKSDVAASTEEPKIFLYARFTPKDAPDPVPVEFIDQELFTYFDDAAEGWHKYAIAWSLRWRSYELRLAASDGAEGGIATRKETLTLPDFRTSDLVMSSVTVAHVAQPVRGSGSAPEAGPGDSFVVGALRLIPWIEPVLGAKDGLSFFYDVYNPKRDPATNHPALDVTYLFERRESSGWQKRGRLFEPGKREQMLGYEIPAQTLAAWPAGDYRLTIQVEDKIAKAETSASVEFSIAR